MATLLSAQDLTLVRAGRAVLDGVGLSVQDGERLALLGRNGAGKTTLLDVLRGALAPEEGHLWRAEGLRLAFLDQHPIFGAGLLVRDLLEAAYPFTAREAELRDLERRLVAEPALLDAWAALHGQLEAEGAYTWRARAAKMLGVLGLSGLEPREAASLSGGERTRLALALALLQEPELLLLDEPTNHLDIRMREWLEAHLLAYRGGVILTSHDREFLDRVASRSLWIEDGAATPYPGGYSLARAQRDLERRTQARAHRLGSREEARLSRSAGQLDRWGRRAQAMQSRLERVQVVEAPLPERKLRMRLLAGQARARLLLWAEGLNKTYGPRPILQGAGLKLRQGDRVALMGANGTGKTTLLRLLAGELYPEGEAARLNLAPGVQVAYLDQTWHGLKPGVALLAQFETRFDARARGLLGGVGFTAADWPKTPEQLSGGERARAGLALMGALRADLLLLDEPTNHLDVETLEQLEAAVTAYPGAVVVVTHDRRFARQVANRLWVIEDARLLELEGWGRKEALDPARVLEGDPPPPPPRPTPRQQLRVAEQVVEGLRRQLDAQPPVTGREEARLRADLRAGQAQIFDLYAQVYGAPEFDAEVREGPLKVRALRFEEGGMFWAAHDESCPHLAWDGYTLRFSQPPPAWYGQHLLAGALRILFEHWNVGRIELGDDGLRLRRRAYFERLGLVAGPAPGRPLPKPESAPQGVPAD